MIKKLLFIIILILEKIEFIVYFFYTMLSLKDLALNSIILNNKGILPCYLEIDFYNYKKILYDSIKLYNKKYFVEYFHLIKDFPVLIKSSIKLIKDFDINNIFELCSKCIFPQIIYFINNINEAFLLVIQHKNILLFEFLIREIVISNNDLIYYIIYILIYYKRFNFINCMYKYYKHTKLWNTNFIWALYNYFKKFNNIKIRKLKKFVDINWCDKNGCNVLMFSVRNKKLDLLMFLINNFRKVIDINLKDFNGYNALDYSIKKNKFYITKILLYRFKNDIK